MTGRTQHSRVGGIPMNIPPKYLEHIQHGAADSGCGLNQRWRHLTQFAVIFYHRSHIAMV